MKVYDTLRALRHAPSRIPGRLSYPIPLRRCMGNVEFPFVSELYVCTLHVFLRMLLHPEILGDSLTYPIPLRRCMGNVEFPCVSELYLCTLHVWCFVLCSFYLVSGGWMLSPVTDRQWGLRELQYKNIFTIGHA